MWVGGWRGLSGGILSRSLLPWANQLTYLLNLFGLWKDFHTWSQRDFQYNKRKQMFSTFRKGQKNEHFLSTVYPVPLNTWSSLSHWPHPNLFLLFCTSPASQAPNLEDNLNFFFIHHIQSFNKLCWLGRLSTISPFNTFQIHSYTLVQAKILVLSDVYFLQ